MIYREALINLIVGFQCFFFFSRLEALKLSVRQQIEKLTDSMTDDMTEQAYFTTLAQKDCFHELDVEEFEVVGTLDGITCTKCGSRDGEHYPLKYMESGVNAPPFHPYCRCTTCPYFDDVEGYRASRDEEGRTIYDVPANMTYTEWKKAFVDGDKDSLVLQEYRPVTLGVSEIATINDKNYKVKSLKNNRYEIYVSDSVKLKPKQLHYFENNFSEALRLIGETNSTTLPKFYIVNNSEMKTGALARFNAKENTLMVDVTFCDKQKLLNLQDGCACPRNEFSTAVHELLHWKDAQSYIRKYGKISDQNRYIEYLVNKHAKSIEKLLQKGYNIYGISSYANKMLIVNRYDEVYTEYRVKQILSG